MKTTDWRATIVDVRGSIDGLNFNDIMTKLTDFNVRFSLTRSCARSLPAFHSHYVCVCMWGMRVSACVRVCARLREMGCCYLGRAIR